MPTRPGIIIPAVPFASWADKGRALVVMGAIMSDRVGPCQNDDTPARRAYRGTMSTSTLAAGFLLTDEKDASRYTLTRDGQLVSVLDYRDDGSTVALTRAFTIPTFRGHGYAGTVVEGAVGDLLARGDRQVDAVCWYVSDWFTAHPEHAHLLRTR
jgi:predicted GNAT family acetyltransferase